MVSKLDNELIWKCPKCGENFYGWSNLKICDICGYQEKDPLSNREKNIKPTQKRVKENTNVTTTSFKKS